MSAGAVKIVAALAIWGACVVGIRYFLKPRQRRRGDSGDSSGDDYVSDSSDAHHGGWFGHGGDASHGGHDGGGPGGGGDIGGDGSGGD